MTPTRPPARRRRRAVTLTGADFHRLVRAVLPCVATGGALPVLNAVHLETSSYGVYAAATDRYAVAVARHAAPHPSRPHTHATIPREAVAVMLRLVPRNPGPITIRIGTGSRATLTTASGTYHVPADRELFPDWRKLFARLLTGAPVRNGDPVNLNPVYLARFKAAAEGTPEGLRTHLRQNGTRAPVLIVSAGDWFLGALASISASHTADGPYTTWKTDLTPAAAA